MDKVFLIHELSPSGPQRFVCCQDPAASHEKLDYPPEENCWKFCMSGSRRWKMKGWNNLTGFPQRGWDSLIWLQEVASLQLCLTELAQESLSSLRTHTVLLFTFEPKWTSLHLNVDQSSHSPKNVVKWKLNWVNQDGKLCNSRWGIYNDLPELTDYIPLNPQKYPQTEMLTFSRTVRQDILHWTRHLRHILQCSVRNRFTKLFCYIFQSHLFLYLCWLLLNNFCYSYKTANKEIFLSVEPKLGLQIVILSSSWEMKEMKFWSWMETGKSDGKSGTYNSLYTTCFSQNAPKLIYPKCV